MLALEAQRLTKRFGPTCAVDGAGVAVAPGEVRGLLGPNGAGKTTLLRMLLGLVRPDAGRIEIFGRAAREAGAALSPLVAGLVEEPALYPYLSAEANLRTLALLDGGAAEGRVERALAEVELTADADRRVAGFSTGMRQRLGLASVLLREPRLLLLDEPTAGLDPAGMRLVQRLVRGLGDRGVAVLLSSHQIAEVERICDTFTVMSRGRVVWEGSEREMRRQAAPPSFRLETSDDPRAAALAGETAGLRWERLPDGGLEVQAGEAALDRLVLALGRSGIAVRRLERPVGPLEAMFFALTEEREDAAAAGPAVPRRLPAP